MTKLLPEKTDGRENDDAASSDRAPRRLRRVQPDDARFAGRAVEGIAIGSACLAALAIGFQACSQPQAFGLARALIDRAEAEIRIARLAAKVPGGSLR